MENTFNKVDVFKEFNKLSEAEIVARAGLQPARQFGYICPACGNGAEGKHGSGINQRRGKKRLNWWCGRCGGNFSNVDIYSLATGITDSRELADMLRKELAMPVNTNIFSFKEKPKETSGELKDYTRWYGLCRQALREFVESVGGAWRGLSYKTLADARVGYCRDFANSGKACVILPYDKHRYFAREVDGDFRCFTKNASRSLYVASSLKTGKKTFNLLVEGELDALSLKQVLYQNCIAHVGIAATGSIHSVQRTVDELNAKFGDAADKPKIIWVGDNDKAGVSGAATMIRAFRQAGYFSTGFFFADADSPKLDANAYLQQHGDDGLKAFVVEAVKSQWKTLRRF